MLAKGADHLLDARVDVRAVERGDACVDEGGHVTNRFLGIDVAVPAGELPAALQETGDAVTGREFGGLDGHRECPSCGRSGTAVTSECRNIRFPSLVIRKRDGQFGSGQATSASVDIQSL